MTDELDKGTDSYDSLAFKGESASFLNAVVISSVEALAENGSIYPPLFPNNKTTSAPAGPSNNPNSEIDGRVSPAEAVAMRVVAEEGYAVAKTVFESDQSTSQFRRMIGIPDVWPSDIVDGMAVFGNQLRLLARVREQLTLGEKAINESAIPQRQRDFLEKYKKPLELDGMNLRGATVQAVVEDLYERAETEIVAIPEGARNEEEIRQRIRSRRKGIELGSTMYKQVLDIATQRGLNTSIKEDLADRKGAQVRLLPTPKDRKLPFYASKLPRKLLGMFRKG